MRNWSGQIFPITILSILAALTFVLQSVVDRGDPRPSAKTRHEPDAIAENFSILRFDANGQVKYRVIAPYMEHYPDDDTSYVRNPTLVSYRPDAEPIVLSSRHAQLSSRGETTYLWEDVVVHREASTQRPTLVARMPDLTVQTEAGLAFTGSPVEITQNQSWLKGIGMQIDNNQSTFVLQSNVTGLYFRQKAQP